jgi:hypothetical protein
MLAKHFLPLRWGDFTVKAAACAFSTKKKKKKKESAKS